MASIAGTFTAAQQTSTDLTLGARESLNVILTRTGSGDFSVALEERVTGLTYQRVTSYAADTAGTVYNNDTDARRYFRLVCLAVVGNDSIAYTLADVAADSLAGFPVRNAAGTVVLDVTDAGVEAPLFTGPLTGNVTGDLAGSASGTTATYTRVNVGAAAAAATSASSFTKAVAALTDNVATTVLTVTVPNAAHSAIIRISALGSLGAGGDIGAGEAVDRLPVVANRHQADCLPTACQATLHGLQPEHDLRRDVLELIDQQMA